MDNIRFFDVLFALIGIIVLSPVFIIVALCIKFNSNGPVFFRQSRVGLNNVDFFLFKFRSMYTDTEKKGQLTVGGRDPRITSVGYFLRRFKIDELPQFLNVLKGEMSFVGPRPEVRKYVSLYTLKQMEVLSVLPGITDLASIEFRNENELLAKADDPEKFYIQVVMPRKIELNYRFIEHRNLKNYFTILFTTVATAVKGK